MAEVTVRPATPKELPTARGILEAALLEVPAGACRRWLTLVACEEGRILGACVLDGCEIAAIAVRPNRRGQGIGSALIEYADRSRPSLSAEFDSRVRPFYESLAFEIERIEGGSDETRFLGVRGR